MIKYPYIADKTMYFAVKYACQLIRETGWFNKAVEEAADYYNVDEEELKRHIRERQAAGQKGKAKGRKYRWYILNKCYTSEAHGFVRFHDYHIVRATSYKNASSHFSEADLQETMRCDYGGVYSPNVFHDVVGEHDGYETRAEALTALKKIEKLGDDRP